MSSPGVVWNRQVFEGAYKASSGWIAPLRSRLSFDQQSKCGTNWALLRSWMAGDRPVHGVLEVGFGFGLCLRRFDSSVLLAGTEISISAATNFVRLCIRDGRHAAICVNDSSGHLPFRTVFDVIICSHVLEHIPDDVSILQEFRRLLAPGGVLLLNVPINEVAMDPNHVHRYTKTAMVEMLLSVGFEVSRSQVSDRWSAFFIEWRRRYGNGIGLKVMRAACALMPVWVRECLGDLVLSRFPSQQLAILASAVEVSCRGERETPSGNMTE